MAVLVSSKYLLLVFLLSMYQRSIGQCPNSLANTVLRPDESLILPQLLNRDCEWKAMPSNAFYNPLLPVTNSTDAKVFPAFAGSLLIGPYGCKILKASVIPVGGALWSPAALYMMQDKEAKCNSSAKVAVLESGPTCECNSSTKTTPAQYICFAVYADSPAIPMNPKITWYSADKKDQYQDKPLPRRIDKYRFKVISRFSFKKNGRTVGAFTPKWCVLTFSAPSPGRFPSIARNAPAFSDSCSFNCH